MGGALDCELCRRLEHWSGPRPTPTAGLAFRVACVQSFGCPAATETGGLTRSCESLTAGSRCRFMAHRVARAHNHVAFAHEADVRRATRLMGWTTPASGIECAKG